MQWYLFVLNNKNTKGLLKFLLDLGSMENDKNKSANEINTSQPMRLTQVRVSQ